MRRLDSRVSATWLVLVLALGGCSATRAFLDIPEEEPASPPPEFVGPGQRSTDRSAGSPPAPPIEGLTDPDSVKALLPRDAAGAIDWVAAVEQDVIRPRAGLAETAWHPAGFSYDFYIDDAGGPEAYFPHSTHAYWVACQSCHPRLYNRDDWESEQDPHEEASCGLCHGTVAFSADACDRCHIGEDMGMDSIEPEAGTITMSRDAEAGGSQASAGVAAAGDQYPPATFPHWTHRLRYRCTACHDRPFEMDAGVAVPADLAHGASGCGSCHDGKAAFGTGISECHRCHAGDQDSS